MLFLSSAVVHGTTAHDAPNERARGCAAHASLAFETPHAILRDESGAGVGGPRERAQLQREDGNPWKLDLDYETYFFGMIVMKMYQIRSLMFLEK